jgi:hypothetical protein
LEFALELMKKAEFGVADEQVARGANAVPILDLASGGWRGARVRDLYIAVLRFLNIQGVF